jgi:hypothetical protein
MREQALARDRSEIEHGLRIRLLNRRAAIPERKCLKRLAFYRIATGLRVGWEAGSPENGFSSFFGFLPMFANSF